ncbi:MAG: ribosome maturation factor RimM [Pseudomonadota bacterium]
MPRPPPASVVFDHDGHIIMARIAAAQGIRGDVRLQAYCDDPMALARYNPYWGSNGQSYEIRILRARGESQAIAHLPGCDDRNTAEGLRGVTLSITRAQLEELSQDEFYHHDLIGRAVMAHTGGCIGHITAIVDYGAGPLLVTQGDQGEILLPFHDDVVAAIDDTGDTVTLHAFGAQFSQINVKKPPA